MLEWIHQHKPEDMWHEEALNYKKIVFGAKFKVLKYLKMIIPIIWLFNVFFFLNIELWDHNNFNLFILKTY